MRHRVLLVLLFVGLLITRLCHSGVLWAEESLPLAAVGGMLQGKLLYRDIWFDKPPLTAAVHLLCGGQAGWPVRVLGALYVLAGCLIAYLFAKQKWGREEGVYAASGLAFFLTFGIPSAVIPLAADLLMLVPHMAAVYLVWRGRFFWSGVLAGVAFQFNSKALVVLLVCALWQRRRWGLLTAGFALPNAVVLAWLLVSGALPSYLLEVWRAGLLYSGDTFVGNRYWNGLERSASWLGFHSALGVCAAWYWLKDRDDDRWRMALWAALAALTVAAGWRFFPRYYFALLPVAVLAAARGFALLGKRRWLVLPLLLIPLVRFGPRYVTLARGGEARWRDAAMDQDSRAAAALVRRLAAPGDTLFVWGFRPEVYVYAGLPAATRFLESQPLTGVFADRHLTQSAPSTSEWAARHRRELATKAPAFVLDGLGPYNPVLRVEAFGELREWLTHYRAVGRTASTIIYRRY
jgi:hypothetical protein